MQLEGSSLVESINNKFTATMTNAIRWRESDEAPADSIRSALFSTLADG